MVATRRLLLSSSRQSRHVTSKEPHMIPISTAATARQPQPGPPPRPLDLEAVKAKQRDTWKSGDYSVVGTTLQIVGETLCEAVDLRSGERVLDVACGNGNAALAAARRFAQVTGVDYVPALLARAGARAAADGLPLDLREGDAEALPFPDGAFDVVLSNFGVMFAPDQERAARELLRVCRHGGRIGLANWTPDGFVGQMFKVVASHLPPPAGLRGPPLWGTEARLAELFGAEARDLRTARREFTFRYRSIAHWLEVFRTWYGPTHRTFAALAPEGQRASGHGERRARAVRPAAVHEACALEPEEPRDRERVPGAVRGPCPPIALDEVRGLHVRERERHPHLTRSVEDERMRGVQARERARDLPTRHAQRLRELGSPLARAARSPMPRTRRRGSAGRARWGPSPSWSSPPDGARGTVVVSGPAANATSELQNEHASHLEPRHARDGGIDVGTNGAVLIGATGLVGSELLRRLLVDERFSSVVVLGRRSTGVTHGKLSEHVIDFDAPDSWSELVKGAVLFSALGTTLRAAGTPAAQYRVDHTYQYRTAEAARRHGVGTYVLVSSAGASPRSRIFYSRMKGELERDVEGLRFPRTRLLRPGPLDGDRREFRAREQWALRVLRPLAPILPASARPIHAALVARAAVEAALDPAPGTIRYEARELFRLGQSRGAARPVAGRPPGEEAGGR
jgi:uncharacterized protein YbjT (DUF2867 family)/SAM-dependent methyltransferase